jgi:hypothetical protein
VSDDPSEPVDFQQGSCVLALSFNVVQVPRIPIHRSMSGQGRNKQQNPDPPIASRHRFLPEGVSLPADVATH